MDGRFFVLGRDGIAPYGTEGGWGWEEGWREDGGDGGMDEPKSAVQRFTWEGVLGEM